LAEARRYTPRGRTVRESAAGRGDPFRPALQVLAGGRADPPRRRTDPARRTDQQRRADGATSRGGTGSGRVPAGRAGGPRTASTGRRSGTKAARPPVRPKVNRGAAPPRPGRPQRRLRVATVLALAMFSIIAGRLVVLQLTDAPAYAAEGVADRTTREVIPAPRGAIVDRDGNLLAHSVEARYIYADPGMVENVEATADALAPLLGQVGIPRSELVPKLRPHRLPNGRPARFEYLARGVDIELGDAVTALNLAGVRVRRDERRVVPGSDLAASVLGFTGSDLTGRTGLEFAYDKQLRGENGERVFEVGEGKLNREIPGGLHSQTPARPGASLELTIDRYLQFLVQQTLAERLQQVKASIGAAVVLDVRTGEVLAQASFPGFNAASPPADPQLWVDTSSGLIVDPGSTHKAIVMGAALEEGVVTLDTAVVVGPKIVKGDREFVDAGHRQPRDVPMTLAGVMAYSSNVGTIRVAEQLGKEKLYEYQRRFGLGEPTGEGLPGEVAGLVRAPKDWSGTSHGSIPIGNGVSTTPLQMAAVYAAIANGGTWVQPHLVRATVGPDGKRSPAPPPAIRKVLDPAVAAQLRELLEAPVVVKGGTGNQAAIPGYRVAGKTGTGGRVVDGRYTDGYVASFIGMAPADAPRFVVAVYAYGLDITGATMAPAFSQMMADTLIRFKVPPTGAPPPVFKVYP
jgi:cell division protein FtsI (penicillin-binding protein 3)